MDPNRESAPVLSFLFLAPLLWDPFRWFVTFSECCVETRAE
jgi:hypothetical protein